MSLFSPRVKTRQLAALCRRMATSLGAGVDFLAARSTGKPRRRSAVCSDDWRLSAMPRRSGSTLAEGLAATGDYFPPLFRQLVEVGEQTGHTAEVFSQLAEHYEHQVAMRRAFVSSIAWPMIELSGAVMIIGLLIWVMGILGKHGATSDVLGWGLKGTSGLLVYITFVSAIAAAIFVLVQAARRGALGGNRSSDPARSSSARPSTQDIGVEPGFLDIASRFGYRHGSAPCAAAGFGTQRQCTIRRRHRTDAGRYFRGRPIHEAMTESRVFPRAYVDAVAVGEESGRLVETLAILSHQQQDEARSALAVLVRLAGFAIWLLVAGLIIMMIFRLAGFYFGAIQNAAGLK